MRVLLQVCCGPCALMPVDQLLAEGHEVMGLYYNPNIHPYTENQRRLQSLQEWAQQKEFKLIVHDQYQPEAWFQQMAFREAQRCRLCYQQRLTRAAQVARRGGFDAFCTTLLYSIRQKHELVAQAGRDAAAQWGVEFLYRDFRPLWKEGVARSLELGLYRQQYCGCLYSERDRYLGPPRQNQEENPSPERQSL